jgi:hypothetical protein
MYPIISLLAEIAETFAETGHDLFKANGILWTKLQNQFAYVGCQKTLAYNIMVVRDKNEYSVFESQ